MSCVELKSGGVSMFMRVERKRMPNPAPRLFPLAALSLAFISALILQPAWAESKSESANAITIDASGPVLAPESGYLRMGGSRPAAMKSRSIVGFCRLTGSLGCR